MGDDRPPLWIGHIAATSSGHKAAHDFYGSLGMRSILVADEFAITELRGGTHLLFQRGEPEPGDAPFDLMAEDLPAIHATWSAAGHDVSDIIEGDVHNVLILTDPGGQRVVVYDDHSQGVV